MRRTMIETIFKKKKMFNIHCVTIMMISLICVVASVVSAQQRIDVKYSIQTIVGTGQTSFNRDGLTGLATTINSPIGLFYEERSGDLYFADTSKFSPCCLVYMSFES